MQVAVEMFEQEIAEAVKTFETYIVCLDKTPEAFQEALQSLMKKAIHAYLDRGPNLRHGIALDKQITVILSQTEHDRPLCGIYFNLHSPYRKKAAARKAKVDEGR